MEIGFYVRVGKENKDIMQLTDAEFQYFSSQHPDDGWRYFKALRDWVLANVVQADDVQVDDVETS
jgi:hypothetical protein